MKKPKTDKAVIDELFADMARSAGEFAKGLKQAQRELRLLAKALSKLKLKANT